MKLVAESLDSMRVAMTSRSSDWWPQVAESLAKRCERMAVSLRSGEVGVAYGEMVEFSIESAKFFLAMRRIGWDLDTGKRSRVR